MDINSEKFAKIKNNILEWIKGFGKKKLAIFILMVIILITEIIVFANRNIIMGNYNCEKGNYTAAITYYSKVKNIKGKTLLRYNNLNMYEDGLKAYDDDDMDKLAELISKLNENPTKYPTKQDIEELTEKFDSREKEISKTDNAISEIEKLLANSDDNLVSTENKNQEKQSPTTSPTVSPTTLPTAAPAKRLETLETNLNTAKKKCDELADEEKLTPEQSAKVNEMKSVAVECISIYEKYKAKNYKGVISDIEQLLDSYKKYGIKEDIGIMKEKSENYIKEQELIVKEFTDLRKEVASGEYEKAKSRAEKILTYDLSESDKKEAEKIKKDAEQKLEEKNQQKKAEEEKKQAETKQAENNQTNTEQKNNQTTSKWISPSGNIYIGVKLYYGAGDEKMYVGEVVDISEKVRMANGKTFRGVCLKMYGGSIEWKDRNEIILSGKWYVKSDDPALNN